MRNTIKTFKDKQQEVFTIDYLIVFYATFSISILMIFIYIFLFQIILCDHCYKNLKIFYQQAKQNYSILIYFQVL